MKALLASLIIPMVMSFGPVQAADAPDSKASMLEKMTQVRDAEFSNLKILADMFDATKDADTKEGILKVGQLHATALQVDDFLVAANGGEAVLESTVERIKTLLDQGKSEEDAVPPAADQN